MKIENDEIHYQADRLLYWTKIFFESDDNTKKSLVLTAASKEYLNDLYKIPSGSTLTKENLDDWITFVANKWKALGDELFKHPIHYDAYANNAEGEANTTDYLLTQIKR